MDKFFNTAGPCNEQNHYMVPVKDRIPGIMSLIDREQYFVIHAARQTGKTTLIKSLTNQINAEGKYYALYCSLETVEAFTEPEKGIPQILDNIQVQVEYSKLPFNDQFAINLDNGKTATIIKKSLIDYCRKLDKPLVMFFDEIDGLESGTLITFLRQLRDGYVNRPEVPFPHSIALVGLRDIRDYKSKLREGRQTLGSKSPFNIIKRAFTLENFSFNEVQDLYAQHTRATGQLFDKNVVDYIYAQTCG